jgi:hypothetical protein
MVMLSHEIRSIQIKQVPGHTQMNQKQITTGQFDDYIFPPSAYLLNSLV